MVETLDPENVFVAGKPSFECTCSTLFLGHLKDDLAELLALLQTLMGFDSIR
jgi:hypothetical protein